MNVDRGAAAYEEAEKHRILKYERLDIRRHQEEEKRMTGLKRIEMGSTSLICYVDISWIATRS